MKTLKNIMSLNLFLKSVLGDFCFKEDEMDIVLPITHTKYNQNPGHYRWQNK